MTALPVVLGTAATVAAVVGAVLVLRRGLVLIRVVGDSMLPSYRAGDRIVVRRSRRYRPGDVVVFRAPYRSDVEWLLKRVVAVAGQPVPADCRAAVPNAVVPPGQLLVRGDAAHSQDSRHFGPVPLAEVLGVALRPDSRTLRARRSV